MKLDCGFTLGDLGQTAYTAYSLALCRDGDPPPPEWQSLKDDHHEAWGEVAGRAVLLVEGADGLAWRSFAEQLCRAWERSMAYSDPKWGTMPAREHAAWEAAARHLANVIDSEAGDITDLAAHEARWRGWADGRPAKEKTT